MTKVKKKSKRGGRTEKTWIEAKIVKRKNGRRVSSSSLLPPKLRTRWLQTETRRYNYITRTDGRIPSVGRKKRQEEMNRRTTTSQREEERVKVSWLRRLIEAR